MAAVAIYHATVQGDGKKYRVNTFPSCKDTAPGYAMAELPFGQSVFGTSYEVKVSKGEFSIKAQGWLYLSGERSRALKFEVYGNAQSVGVNFLDEDGGVFEIQPRSEIIAGRISMKE
jgi:hypothetical protein